MIEKKTLRRQEWIDLPKAAKIHYVYLKAGFTGSNNGEITLTYSSLAGVFSRSTSSTARKELIKMGWIEVTVPGGLSHNHHGMNNGRIRYKLTGKYDVLRNKGRQTRSFPF